MCHPRSVWSQTSKDRKRNKCWFKSIHLPIKKCCFYLLSYMYGCFAYMSMNPKCAWCPGRPEEVTDSLRLEFDCCGPPCGCWESNPGTPEEQPVRLMTEPLRQSHYPLPSCQRLLKSAHLFVIVSGQNLRIKTNMAQQRSERNQLFS